MPPRLLVADDQPDVLTALRLLLGNEGIETQSASSPAGALAAAAASRFDAALIDLNYARDTTSGTEGLDLLARLRQSDPHLPVDRDDRLGDRRTAPWRRCAPARAISSRSPGTTRDCCPWCATSSSWARALRRGQRLEAENALLRGAIPSCR